MQDMKSHDCSGLADAGVPLCPLSVGRITCEYGWNSGIYGPQVNGCGINIGISGSGRMNLLGNTYALNPGDAVWYLPGEDNSVTAVSAQWEYVWIFFSGALAAAILLSYRYPRRLTGGDVGVISELFDELYRTIGPASAANRRNLAALILRILAAIGGNNASMLRKTLTEQFLDLIRAEYADPKLDINTISEQLKVSPSTLHRVISKELKRSPGRMVREQRLQNAHALLRNTELPIGEVAAACGFSDENYFCRQIRRYSRCSPQEFRRREQAKAASGEKTGSILMG